MKGRKFASLFNLVGIVTVYSYPDRVFLLPGVGKSLPRCNSKVKTAMKMKLEGYSCKKGKFLLNTMVHNWA